MELWNHRTMHGTMERLELWNTWNHGMLGTNYGTMESWNHGTMKRLEPWNAWNYGTMEPWNAWNHGTLGTMERLEQTMELYGTMELWNCIGTTIIIL